MACQSAKSPGGTSGAHIHKLSRPVARIFERGVLFFFGGGEGFSNLILINYS